ncbi:MAG: ATP-binding protein [Caldilineaceae bacterium]
MDEQTRSFGTRGPVDPIHNYVVARTAEVGDLKARIKQGRYVVIFAPRQTGKTTFFRWTLESLVEEDEQWFPIRLDFQALKNVAVETFYRELLRRIREEVMAEFQERHLSMTPQFQQFLETYPLTEHITLQPFFSELAVYLDSRKVAIIIDEFDGIPRAALSDFLYTLRETYHSGIANRCPYSVAIVGVKSITQLNYDRSISPFNIQDDFSLPNFSLAQVRTLFEQYVAETGQQIAFDVIEQIFHQTAGQPFLVNRLGQILTDEMGIPKAETITRNHFEVAHQQILRERNTHIMHLTTNIRQDKRFEALLLRIALREQPVAFNLDNELISELSTYGVLVPDADWNCRIQNPIYQYRIIQAFQPAINGLEDEFLPEDTEAGFYDYVAADGRLNLRLLLANFRDFITRAGFRILEVPDTPQEFVGQHLLFGYLDQFVRQVRGFMYLEVRTGRGRMDLIILHKRQKYIIETKLWEGKRFYANGKAQLAAYLATEGESEGYYVVFDHRSQPQAREEEEIIAGKTIVSFVIPVVQKRPSDQG